jgi:hypothetical protein
MTAREAPLFWGTSGPPNEIVRCYQDHIFSRSTGEDVDGCPYCKYTRGERQAQLQARGALMRRLRREGRLKEDV